MIKLFAVNMKIGKRLKECAMIDLDNDAIYTQRDLDEEREAVIEKVLEIIDGRDLWERREDGTMWTVDEEIKQAVLALKVGNNG